MEKQNLIMDDEMVMHETIANQVSISEQEDAYAALEAKYNNVEEGVEQDLLRAQFDRVDEDFEAARYACCSIRWSRRYGRNCSWICGRT